MIEDNSRKIIIHCTCGSLTHILAMDFIDWGRDQEPELYVETVCNPYLSWWARIIPAIKYAVFGKPASIDATIISFEDAVKIEEICDDFTNEYLGWQQRQLPAGSVQPERAPLEGK